MLEKAGVDVLYLPDPERFYPSDFSTAVEVSGVTEGGEGAARPGHFRGVATVVAKLFLQVGPDAAYFGRKDLQQTAVVRRMVRDLDFPVEVVVAPASTLSWIATRPDAWMRLSPSAFSNKKLP